MDKTEKEIFTAVEFLEEEWLHKELRRGEITTEQFNTLMYGNKGNKQTEDEVMNSDIDD